MAAKNAKGRSKRTPDDYFVQFYKTFLQEPAWLSLSMGARVLYLALKAYYNGSNNGEIYLSVRKAATEIGCNPKSADRWFDELVDRGFIRATRSGALGSDGKGEARCWRLTEIGYRGDPPTREYRDYKKQNPVPVEGTGCTPEGDTLPMGCTSRGDTCTPEGDSFGTKIDRPCTPQGDTYISAILPRNSARSANRKNGNGLARSVPDFLRRSGMSDDDVTTFLAYATTGDAQDLRRLITAGQESLALAYATELIEFNRR
ncbi:MAG: hypothetical protein GC201_16410 [Alphaproteobacteria bacterium]|nr:hypothetical protein [Alphaproteobacteria bacterium]